MLVSVERNSYGVVNYHREGEDVFVDYVDYKPFILIPSSDPKHALREKEFTQLAGGHYFDKRVDYRAWDAYYQALRLKKSAVQGYYSVAKSYCMSTGERMFKDAVLDDAVRLVFDIEAEGLDPEVNKVLMIALLTNRGYEKTLIGTETEILRGFVDAVKEVNPDIIEGHNVYAYDLPFIIKRAEVNGVTLRLGRDGGKPYIGRERVFRVGPNEVLYSPVSIHGRHVIDTFLAVQKYDVATQRHLSFGLKAVAREYGISEPERIELPRERMLQLWQEDASLVEKYALQDVRETKRLSEIVLPVEFMQCSVVPDGLTGVCNTGTGEKWNSIMIAEYLKRGKSIPKRVNTEDNAFIGGFVECREVGVFHDVIKYDFESLYPSLMLTRNIESKTDTEHVMLPLLKELKEKRLAAKREMQKHKDGSKEKTYFDGYQNVCKILINSAYGYLGGPFHFSDNSAAEQVTTGGRTAVTQLSEFLEARGFTIIEVDTDGVYACLPPQYDNSQLEPLLRDYNAACSPLVVADDGRYDAMLSLKAKNYALKKGEKITLKGASLRSRSVEGFTKEFMKNAVSTLLSGSTDEVVSAYTSLLVRIYKGDVVKEEICRRERITAKTNSSSAKSRLAATVERLNEQGGDGEEQTLDVGSYIYVYDKDDGTLETINNWRCDYDRLKYMQKARKVFMRLAELFGGEEAFKLAYPNPGKKNMGLLGGDESYEYKPAKTKRPERGDAVCVDDDDGVDSGVCHSEDAIWRF